MQLEMWKKAKKKFHGKTKKLIAMLAVERCLINKKVHAIKCRKTANVRRCRGSFFHVRDRHILPCSNSKRKMFLPRRTNAQRLREIESNINSIADLEIKLKPVSDLSARELKRFLFLPVELHIRAGSMAADCEDNNDTLSAERLAVKEK